jgi:hypothetical protein
MNGERSIKKKALNTYKKRREGTIVCGDIWRF